MKDLDTCNKAGEKIIMKFTNLFGNLIVDGPVYLEVINNKVTF